MNQWMDFDQTVGRLERVKKILVTLTLLAHLSRRLIGELIVYACIRRPSVGLSSVRQYFQTTSLLKLWYPCQLIGPIGL